jgi:4'-phosphopantetheinyl transferase
MVRKEIRELKPDELHIWSCSLMEKAYDVDYLRTILSEDEKEKAKKFKFLKDQQHFIVARGYLRCLLALYLNQLPEHIKIVYGLWGKPQVAGNSLYFNLSHSKGAILYAFVRSYDVGIDLEHINEHIDVEEMALTLLSSQDLSYWNSMTPKAKINAFFRFWVSREAFLKCVGKGLVDSEKNNQFGAFLFSSSSSRNFLFQKTNFSSYLFECFPGYAGACFVKGPPLKILQYQTSLLYLKEG